MIDTITFNPSIDQYLTVTHWVKDDTLRVAVGHRYPGGKGINVSRGLSILGHSTRAFTMVGGMAGYMLRDLLTTGKIEGVFVDISGETRINTIVTDKSDNTQTRLNLPGPEIDVIHRDLFIDLILKTQPRPRFWVFGGSVPPGLEADIYARLIGRVLKDEKEIVEAAQEIVRNGVEVVAATLGSKGAVIAARNEVLKVSNPTVEVKGRVGTGDCFIAGFLDRLAMNENLEQAAVGGAAAGTAAVMHEGTSLFNWEDYERLRSLVRVVRMT